MRSTPEQLSVDWLSRSRATSVDERGDVEAVQKIVSVLSVENIWAVLIKDVIETDLFVAVEIEE